MTAPNRTSTAAYRRLRRVVLRRAKAMDLPCALCGRPIAYDAPHTDPMSFELDHVRPHALGGEDSLANSQPTHKVCNRREGGRLGAARSRLKTTEPRVIRTQWY